MPTSVYSRAVRKAAELLGGRDKLARTLQVPVSEIEKWITEQKKPPREIFLRVVDVIIDDSGMPESSPAEPPPAQDASGASAWTD